MRIVGVVAWAALLAAGLAGMLVAEVPPGHTGRRGGATVAAGLWFQVPKLWPVDVHPLDPPPVSPGSSLPSPEVVGQQAARLRAEAAAIHAAIEADRSAARRAAEAGRETRAAEDAAAERARAAVRAEAAAEAATLRAEAEAEAARVVGEAEAHHARTIAEAELALARAEAERDRQFATALAGPGGRYHAAIEAARRFQLGDLHLDTRDPEFLNKFGSMAAWRRFFLGD